MAVTPDTDATMTASSPPMRVAITTALLTVVTNYWPLLLVTTILVRALINRYISPLRSYPGPFLASCTRLWKTASVTSGRAHQHRMALHARYGPIVRLAPHEVSLASPEAARQLLSAGRRFSKTDFYAVFLPVDARDIFTETREHVHAVKKRVANTPYAMAAMQQLSPFVDEQVDTLVGILDRHILQFSSSSPTPSQSPFDLGTYLHYFAFDVLGEVAFSRNFGFLAEGRDIEGAIGSIDRSQTYSGIIGQIPELDYLMRRNPLRRILPGLEAKQALITRMALSEMDKRRPFTKEGGNAGVGVLADGRRDLMASLIEGHLKDPERFDEGDVFAVAHGAIFAGSDSTASTMQSFFWYILTAPRIYAALTAELDAAVARGAIPAAPAAAASTTDKQHTNLAWAESQSLPYFQACLKEAMRIRPAVGLDIVRQVPPEGAELDGRFFPGGTRVAVNGWVVHRDKDVFGSDADVFRPERWLEDEEKARQMERYMVHFGGGSHLCIGRHLALMEMNKVVPRLLRDFHFELVHPDRELKTHASFFVVQEGLEVYVRKR